jgi:hypothetical protein
MPDFSMAKALPPPTNRRHSLTLTENLKQAMADMEEKVQYQS